MQTERNNEQNETEHEQSKRERFTITSELCSFTLDAELKEHRKKETIWMKHNDN